MGHQVSTIAQAIAWSGGSTIVLSLFVVWDGAAEGTLELSVDPPPLTVKRYPMEEDEPSARPERVIVEYDLVYPMLPPSYGQIIGQCFDRVRAAGAYVAWFAFEGSFSFDRLLTGSCANQVYALCDSAGVAVATDETLNSPEWQQRVAQAGRELRPA